MHRFAFAIVCFGSVAYAQLPEPVPAPTPAPLPSPEPAPPVESPPPPPQEIAPPAPTPEPVVGKPDKTSVEVEGYLQPQFRIRQDSQVQDDTNGFRFARVRPMIRAKTELGGVEFGAFFEFEFQPTFQMIDGFAGLTKKFDKDGLLILDVGQMRVPISRQQLLSDSRIAFVDKAQLASIAPRRDLGGRATIKVPGAPVKVIAGVFNGEGPNQIENINQKFLYAGRLELNVLGHEGPLQESNFGDAYLTIGGSVGYNKPAAGERVETVKYFGGDIAGAYKGLSGTFEYLLVRHSFVDTGTQADMNRNFDQNGFTAQLNYLLPFTVREKGRVEVGARVEEIDRNDTIPIVAAGEPEQSVRILTGVLTFYARKHSLKLQLQVSHYIELEDLTATRQDATYDNDQAVFQLTYRMD